jgi:hypothetical protein
LTYIVAMQQDLSPQDARLLIEYARRKYLEERWPLSPALREVRKALAKLDPKPAAQSFQGPRPYMPSMLARKNQRR